MEDGLLARALIVVEGDVAVLVYAVPEVVDDDVAKVPYEVGSVNGGIDNG